MRTQNPYTNKQELINAELRVYALRLERAEQRRAAAERAFINAHPRQALAIYEQLCEESLGWAPDRGVLFRKLKESLH